MHIFTVCHAANREDAPDMQEALSLGLKLNI